MTNINWKLDSKIKQGILIYAPGVDAMFVRYGIDEYSDYLEQGTVLNVLVDDEWIVTSLDQNHCELLNENNGWNLYDIEAYNINGLLVRLEGIEEEEIW